MNQSKEPIDIIEVVVPEGDFTITLSREDLTDLYPRMYRYEVRLLSDGRTIALFSTNTYEYSPRVPLDAQSVAENRAIEWKEELTTNAVEFLERLPALHPICLPAIFPTDVVIIQGSPRPDGNCSILAGWAVEAARSCGKTAQVLYLDDLEIHPCIGCYQCYNTGICTFEDDMEGIIHAMEHAELLVVCTPVYTNTVPGGLKLAIDRFQSFHAKKKLFGAKGPQKGLLFSVAGRKGYENFTCVREVISASFGNLGIEPKGEILIDGVDVLFDIRSVEGLEGRVRSAVSGTLGHSR
jgi:multimeric flavodoxin WrbA